MRLPSLAAVLVFVCVPPGLRAQAMPPAPPTAPAGPGSILGLVVDDGGRPVAAAAVVVRREADSVAVADAVTSPSGRFRVTGLALGRYAVRITHLGYASQTRAGVALTQAAPSADLVIRLAVSAVAVAGIEVNAEKAAVVLAPDRNVYATKDMPAASAGTAVDVLRNVPEVDVDIDGKVSLRGNGSVAIHINGRPSPLKGDALANFLQQFPASRIERVEVIPNPSAKFDPEGMVGIVNIVLKNDADLGLSGSLTARGGNAGGGGNGRLAYQRGALTLFGGGGSSANRSRQSSRDFRQNLLASPVTSLDQSSRRNGDNRFYSGDFSAELHLSKEATLYTAFNGFRSEGDADVLLSYALLDPERVALEQYVRSGPSGYAYDVLDASLGFRRVVKPQQDELTIEARASRNGEGTDDRMTKASSAADADAPAAGELTLGDVDTRTREVSLQADYTHPLGASLRLDAGYKGSLRRSTGDSRLEVFAPAGAVAPAQDARSAFTHDERFHSAYLLLQRSFGKLGVQAGVRAERAATTFELRRTGEAFDNDYTSVFPSLNLSYDLGPGRQARLAYSKRIERPSSFYLNPDVPSTDPLNRMAGNPYLKPKYTHSVTLDLSWTLAAGTLRLSPYWRRTVDNWDWVKLVDSAGVSTMTFRNLASLEAYGATVTGSLRPGGRLSGFGSLGVYRQVRDASNISTQFSGSSLHWSATLTPAFKATSSLDLQGTLRYSPAQDLPQGKISAWLMSSIGAKQRIWGNQAWASLYVNDPFGLMRFEFTTRDTTHVQTSRSTFMSRTVALSFTYSFGRAPQPTVRRPSTEQPQTEPAVQIH